MQPLVGMNTTVALGEDWQAFLAMDAGGFGLNGKQDLSGTVEAGLAYALGNSAQISLAYRYSGSNTPLTMAVMATPLRRTACRWDFAGCLIKELRG